MIEIKGDTFCLYEASAGYRRLSVLRNKARDGFYMRVFGKKKQENQK